MMEPVGSKARSCVGRPVDVIRASGKKDVSPVEESRDSEE